jgi:uncharacterized protein (UPF0335 family)
MTDVNRVTESELRAFVERVERLNAEAADIAEAKKELFSEIKGRGYDGAVIKKLVAMRKREPSDLAEQEAVLTLYKDAMGM